MNPRLLLGLALVLTGGLCGCATAERHGSANVDETCKPLGKLVRSGQTLYGTTSSGSSWWADGGGAVFKVSTDGSGFAILHRFSPISYPNPTNSEGASPMAGLVLSGDTLYGTTSQGGAAGCGTVFKIKINGKGFAVLHTFVGADGARPLAGLALSGDTLYGTTQRGLWTTQQDGSNQGVVFKVNTDGTGFATLHVFTKLQARYYTMSDGFFPPYYKDADGTSPHYLTNTDGAFLQSQLVLSSNVLYGTAWSGGPGGGGTIFKVNADGTGFGVLHGFAMDDAGKSTHQDFKRDGAWLEAGLAVSGNLLYGAASEGGPAGDGTIFKINTDGTGFTVLKTNAGGTSEDLILSGKMLYGIASRGKVFKFNAAGPDISTLPIFEVPNGGISGLILSGGTFYGTTPSGGSRFGGTVFKLNRDGTRFTVLHSFLEEPPPPGMSD